MRNFKTTFILGLLIFAPILMAASCEDKKDEMTVESKVPPHPKNRIVVDVRTVEEFNTGAIDGAINIPLNELESRLDEVRNFDEIVVYCASGARSTQAKMILDNAGHKNVINGGGIQQMRQ